MTCTAREGKWLHRAPQLMLYWIAQVLHVAVLRRHYDTVQALMDFEFPLMCKNGRRWMPIDEAVSLRDRRMVKVLHTAEVQQIKALHKAKRGALLKTMEKMNDVTFKVSCPLPFLTAFQSHFPGKGCLQMNAIVHHCPM